MLVGRYKVPGAVKVTVTGKVNENSQKFDFPAKLIEQSGDEICLFSSDYPHVEGGRKPIRRFEASLGRLSEEQKQGFYFDNFADLMGSALAS